MNLTKEQREAIELGLEEIGTAVFRNHGVNEIKEKKLLAADAVLRDLLSGSKSAWEVTEDRTRTLKNLALLHEPTFSPEIAVLRAMLDEARP